MSGSEKGGEYGNGGGTTISAATIAPERSAVSTAATAGVAMKGSKGGGESHSGSRTTISAATASAGGLTLPAAAIQGSLSE